jgi:hypothetical protein
LRQRFPITLAAAGRWPASDQGRNLPAFNWIKIDNRGSGSVDFGLAANPHSGDLLDTLGTVAPGKVRVFNVEPHNAPTKWPRELFLVSAAGTTLMVEISDQVIVDMVSDTPASDLSTGSGATTSSVASSATVVTLLAANAARRMASFYNDSTAILYLKLGATATASDYTVQMAANSFYELPLPAYTGIVTGLWASANGNVRVTEQT